MAASEQALGQSSADSQDFSGAISSVEEIVKELKAGRMVILIDEEDRENEGDLVMAAEFVTPEAINFMVTHARGLVCLTLTEERCRQLDLPLMSSRNGTVFETNFTVSIEAAHGVHTGISVADRARTIEAAVAPDAKPQDLVQPGHIFPVQAMPGGVLVRAGHTEAGCDLTAMAGLEPAAVICEILKDDGTMARLPDLVTYAQKHQLKIGTIADLIQYRSQTESVVDKLGERQVTTRWGEFLLTGYQDTVDGHIHLALSCGEIDAQAPTLVRVHEPTTVLDFICDQPGGHTWSIESAMQSLKAAGSGVIVFLNANTDAQNLVSQFDDIVNQDAKEAPVSKTPPRTNLRTYGIGAQILRDLGVGKMCLLARPRKMPSIMQGFGLEVVSYDDGSQFHTQQDES
ncbi:bifunctional 3,4-dihydroxy-2-butanone-4-phosphate synthase/GTP cyclohydrolase II [Orrella sp. 11846]|uniref:bifunctional 3,4-dihydroxy-2-butanone-4-phosphate synthase/GTP cyclohydrolase II n=1 Tax=Orrella sp. 11846 TaxID=3409913 RepID=UPI003B5BEA20